MTDSSSQQPHEPQQPLSAFLPQDMMQLVMDNIPARVFWKDTNCVYQGCNQRFANDAGVSTPKDIVGKTGYDLIWGDSEAELYRSDDKEVMNSMRPRLNFEEPQKTADGDTRYLRTSKIPLTDANGQVVGVLGTYEDITERKRIQQQLQQTQKMDSLGALAGGVAHDFNNLLGAILGGADLLDIRIGSQDPDYGHSIRTIISAAERAKDLTSKLLTFSRKGQLVARPFDVNSMVRDALTLVKATVDKRITIISELDDSALMVVGDANQLENCLLNLALNARDAMHNEGELHVRTMRHEVSDTQHIGTDFTLVPGGYVKLEVSDTGEGISEDNLERIFEPFYTTKTVGKGTGLGLSAVYGAVQDHRGALSVSSELTVGTTFTLYLPLTDKVAQETTEASDATPRGQESETILVVDDESLVRNTARTILSGMGYTVMVAADGKEAVELYAKEGDKIDLVLLDMVMPHMNGEDAFRRIRMKDPEAKIILSSGYIRDQNITELIERGAIGFLHKPYRASALLQDIRSALDT